MARKKINGEIGVVLEKIAALKESQDRGFENQEKYMKDQFDNNREEHRDLFLASSSQKTKVATNSTFIKIGGGLMVIIVGILIKLLIG